MKADVVFWIINVVTKSGNAPFRHFQLNADNSEAKFPLVFKSDKSRPKSRVPELCHDSLQTEEDWCEWWTKMAANLNVFKKTFKKNCILSKSKNVFAEVH